MSSPNTLLVDGHDLRAQAGIQIVGAMQLYAPGTRRGSNDIIPGRRGQIGAELVYDAYSFTVDIMVKGATREAMVANLAALGVILGGTNGLVALERKMAKVGGGTNDMTAAGQFVGGLSLAILNPITGMTQLQFVNLDGAWTPDSGTTWVVP